MAYRVESIQDIQNLLTLKLAEGPSLEYKRELSLAGRDARREVLKDLTGMANSGGGTVVFGIAEDPESEDLPGSVHPLTDSGTISRLQAIVRDGVNPPLLAEYQPIPWEGGYILAVHVIQSSLGPYMVEGYDEGRYYRRAGRMTAKMSEREVRDAYALAMRWQEDRAARWHQYGLPIPPPADGRWFTLSAVPEGPSHDAVDPAILHPHALRLPEDRTWILGQADIGVLYQNLRVWGQGYYAEERVDTTILRAIRIARTGAVGLGVATIGEVIGPWFIRMLDAQLLLLTLVWGRIGYRSPVELRVDLHHPAHFRLAYKAAVGYEGLEVVQPWGVDEPPTVTTVDVILPWELASAPHRHRLVRKNWDRLHQVFGRANAPGEDFQAGWLYAMAGGDTSYYLGPGGIQTHMDLACWLCADGALERRQDSEVVGWVDQGVVYDLEGAAVAATAFAMSFGLPRNYVVPRPLDTEVRTIRASEPKPGQGRLAPAFTGAQSQLSLNQLLQAG